MVQVTGCRKRPNDAGRCAALDLPGLAPYNLFERDHFQRHIVWHAVPDGPHRPRYEGGFEVGGHAGQGEPSAPRRQMGIAMAGSEGQQDLIAQATRGDAVALEELLLDHYARLSRHIAPKLAGRLEKLLTVEDIVQETFIQAIRDIRKCQALTERSFAAWLNTIADHCLQDAVRKRNRKKRGGDRVEARGAGGDPLSSMADLVEMLSDHGHTPSESAARHEAIQAVQVGIAGLPDDQREAVWLHHLVGKSIEETAAAMDRTPASVRGLLQRARQALRDALVRSTLWLSKK